MKNKTSRGPGRPMAVITIPKSKFTFADLEAANPHVTALTLRKFLARDAKKSGRSEIVRLKNESREPDSKKGLGRKTFVYSRRSSVKAAAPAKPIKAKSLKTARKSTVSVSMKSDDYEAKKAAILADAPAPIAPPIATEEIAPATEAISAETNAVATEATATV